MPNIQINIKNKVARADRAIIVCDNSDYTAVFDFDDEWSAYETKTARFVYGGTYTDVVFTGSSCPIPEIHDARSLTIGVYAGDLHTTTPAYVSCVPSILCGNGIPADPTPDVYAQIMELLNKDSGVWYPTVDDAGNMSWTRSMSETQPQSVNIKGQKGDAGANGADGKDGISPAVSVAAITGGNRITITDAEGAKTFDVMDGAQGASGADGKDYVLTDTDKQEIAKTAAGLVDVPSVQPDWNQNDPTQQDYVKNRPFYTGDTVETVLVEESTVTFANSGGLYVAQIQPSFEATVGETYKVYWDGAAYECICTKLGRDFSAIGNLSILGEGPDTGEPFVMGIANGERIQIMTADTSASHTVSISVTVVSVVKIDEKYLPNTVATKSDVDEKLGNCIKTVNGTAPDAIGNVEVQTISEDALSTNQYGNVIIVKNGVVFKNRLGQYSATTIGESNVAFLVKEGETSNNSDTVFAFAVATDTSNGTSVDQICLSRNGINFQSENVVIRSFESANHSVDVIQLNSSTSHGVMVELTKNACFVLPSSTAGSTKKFKITVDDSGTITATEVS